MAPRRACPRFTREAGGSLRRRCRRQTHASPSRRAIRKLEDLDLRRVLHVSEWLEIPTLVSLFDLLSIVPKSLSWMLVDHLGVNIAPIPASIPRVPIFAVWHEARRHDPAHQWLRKVVAEELRRQADA